MLCSPYYCAILFVKSFLSHKKALSIFSHLKSNLTFSSDSGTKRKVLYFGSASYTYGNVYHPACSLSNETLISLLKLVESFTGLSFNSILCNYYRNGIDYIPWHSDNENSIVENYPIVSLSFGASRPFLVKNETFQVSFVLSHGSLIVMSGHTQTYFKHSIPPDKALKEDRLNLSFRRMKQK